MNPLKVTAWLGNKLAVSDDWSPSFDALMIKLLLDEKGLASSNPTPDDFEQNRPLIEKLMPIKKGEIGGEWYWQTSSPFYLYDSDSVETIHKRWDQQERNLDWEGKRRNWSTSETNTKSWTIQIAERTTPRIDWYCVGDRDEIIRLLRLCNGLAKKRRTQVVKWDVEEIRDDVHMWQGKQLMRPIPTQLADRVPAEVVVRNWAWRPPTHVPSNKTQCFMPVGNVAKMESIYAWELG